MYDPTEGLSREAEKALLQFAESPNVLQQCQVIMEQTQVGGAGRGRDTGGRGRKVRDKGGLETA